MRSALTRRGRAGLPKAATIALYGLLTACATTGPEYVEVDPNCSVPPRPALPSVAAADFNQGEAIPEGTQVSPPDGPARVLDDGGWLLAPHESRLSDELFARTRERESRLVSWALELEAALAELCDDE